MDTQKILFRYFQIILLCSTTVFFDFFLSNIEYDFDTGGSANAASYVYKAFLYDVSANTLSANVVSATSNTVMLPQTFSSTNDAYVGVFYPSCQTTDLSGSAVVQPPSHMMIRTIIRNDEVAYPWLAPAGTRRGVIDNVEIGRAHV